MVSGNSGLYETDCSRSGELMSNTLKFYNKSGECLRIRIRQGRKDEKDGYSGLFGHRRVKRSRPARYEAFIRARAAGFTFRKVEGVMRGI